MLGRYSLEVPQQQQQQQEMEDFFMGEQASEQRGPLPVVCCDDDPSAKNKVRPIVDFEGIAQRASFPIVFMLFCILVSVIFAAIIIILLLL